MASKKKSTTKRKPTHAKKNISKKSKPKKPVGRALQKRARNTKTSAKLGTAKKTKSVARKVTRRPSTVRYARKSIRTPRKYTTSKKLRSFKIKKKDEKFTPALKVTPKNIKKLAKKARAYTKNSKKSVFIKMKIKDKQTKTEKWVSLPRAKMLTDEQINDAFDQLAEYANMERYAISTPLISEVQIEQSL